MRRLIKLFYRKKAILAIFSLFGLNLFADEKPNIVIIYADDLGYGDLGAYGSTKLKTPNIDKLAEAGVQFTNGPGSSATCTPSRYALLTGQYPWRNQNAKILPGSAPLLIETSQMTLPRIGLLENTLVVFTSDNGPVLNDGYYDDAVEKLGDHKPWGPLRGGKYSLFEAGTLIPFIIYWEGKITPVKSDALISQLDLMTSLGELVGSKTRGPDSKELLDVFMGKSQEGREQMVLEAQTRTALKKGNWLMIPPYKGPEKNNQVNIELGNSPEFQLYNLESDLAQKKKMADENPGKLKEMVKTFEKIRGNAFGNIE